MDGTPTVTQMTSTPEGGNPIPLVWHFNATDGVWEAVLSGDTTMVVFTVTMNDDGTYTISLDDPLALDGVFSGFTINFTGGGVSGGNTDQLIFFDGRPRAPRRGPGRRY